MIIENKSLSRYMCIAPFFYCHVHMSDMNSIIALCSKGTPIWIAHASERQDQSNNNTIEICQTYTSEGYSCMTDDTVRNQFFKLGIQFIVDQQKRWNWLEIGCGASAILTKSVLSASLKTQITALEVNPFSATNARKVLKASCSEASRWNVLTTSSFDYVNKRNDCKTAVLFEIFGLIAGAEGVCACMHDLRSRDIVQSDAAMVPQRAASFYGPVQIDVAAVNTVSKQALYISKKLALMKRLDFERCLLSPTVGILDSYDFTDPNGSENSSLHSSFTIARDGYCHGFGVFVALATAGTAGACRRWPSSTFHADWSAGDLWCSSNTSDARYSTSWRNPVILLPEVLAVRKNDMFSVRSMVQIETMLPAYKLSYTIKRANKTISAGELSMTMNDMYPRFVRVQ